MSHANLEVDQVCHPCGITANYLTCLRKYGNPPKKACFDLSTYHHGVCDVCGRMTSVTESRDFFYPTFSLLFALLDRAEKKFGTTPQGTVRPNNRSSVERVGITSQSDNTMATKTVAKKAVKKTVKKVAKKAVKKVAKKGAK